MKPGGRLVFLLAALFFLSGASALIYQVLWLRLLGLVFGVTVYAASTVWAMFMAGLALGSWAGGRAADRVRRPIVWFGAVEALIGITAFASPQFLDAIQSAYAALHASLNPSGAALTAIRLAMSCAVLIVPSTLMGATLPLVVKSSAFGGGELGARVGVLYATNTAGAIAGSLCAGLVLIPIYGIQASFLAAAACNAAVAAAAIAFGRGVQSAPRAPEGAASTPEPRLATGRAVVLAVFALSGFVSLGLEVVWFRILTLFLRPTVYAYSMMLAAVLAGIAAGSYLAAPWLRGRRSRDWIIVLAWLEAAIAIASLASFAVLPAVPWIVARAGPIVSPLVGDYLAYQVIVSAAAILPTMLLCGVAFPIGVHVWSAPQPDAPDAASRIGTFYSLNVAGAILGSLGVGFVVLPRLGARGTLIALATLALASSLALFAVRRRSRSLPAVIAVAVFMGIARLTPDPFGAFLDQRFPGQEIIWKREAVQATVSVHRDPGGTLTLHVNGNHQAGGPSALHQRIGNLPMTVHPDARDALVVGLGGGATGGALSQHGGVSVDVVEISREVADAAGRFFKPINFDLLHKPAVHLRIDDGRNYLMLTDRRYDVITADVILPIHAGSGNLYSADYFRLVRRALKPGGIAVQWVAGTEAEYKTIARTFTSVFPETTIWADGTLLLGSVEPLRLRREDFDRKLGIPERREMMAQLGVRSWEDLLRMYKAGPAELSAYIGPGPILTDDLPLVEYFLSLPRDRDANLSGVAGDVMRHVEK